MSGRPPILPPGEEERRQAARAAAAMARCRVRRKAAGLTANHGTPRQRRPKGSDPLPRKPRTEEQKARAKERRKQKKSA